MDRSCSREGRVQPPFHPIASICLQLYRTAPASQLYPPIFQLCSTKGGDMESIRRITISLLCIAFCLGAAVTSSSAQPGRARWEGNRGLHRGWTTGRHRGWDNRGRRYGWTDSRYGRLSWRERRRLERQRNRLYNMRKRFYSDGYYSPRERRRLMYGTYRYRRNIYRDRRDW